MPALRLNKANPCESRVRFSHDALLLGKCPGGGPVHWHCPAQGQACWAVPPSCLPLPLLLLYEGQTHLGKTKVQKARTSVGYLCGSLRERAESQSVL